MDSAIPDSYIGPQFIMNKNFLYITLVAIYFSLSFDVKWLLRFF
jgi:hypothetical protein